MTPKHVGALYK